MVKNPPELTVNEVYYLKQIVFSELQKYEDRVAHAASHGQEYSSVYGQCLASIVKKIDE